MKGVEDIYPLTPAQLGILFDSLRDPDPELYFEQVRCDIVGPLDADEFRLAWKATIDAHPALRTIWLWQGLDDPVQVVHERVELPWREIDWSAEPDDRRRQLLDELAQDDRTRGFDLSEPPVMRITVVHLGEHRLHLVWSFHHVALDGWSAARVLDEVFDRCAGIDVAAAPPFRDHVAWLEGQDQSAAETHWRRLLDGFDEPTRIVGSRVDDGAPVRRTRATLCLDADSTDALTSAAREHRVTINTLVQAAWAVALSCLSGDDDVVFGVTGSGRPSDVTDVEAIVGMFLSTLPMRVQFDGDRTVRELWHELRAQQLDLTQFQYSSLADIIGWTAVPSGTPLFETVLIFENFPRPDDRGRDIDIEHHEVFEQTRFPLTVMVGSGDVLEAVALYDAARFEDGSAERLLDGFRSVLERMAERPDDQVWSMSVLSDAERVALVSDANDNDRPVPDGTVHDAIRSCAARHPDAIALIDDTRTVSYAELMREADAVAHRLHRRGVRPGDAVLIAMDRSASSVTAALGVISAGAAYVPVDPATPPARLRTVVQNAAPTLALATPEHIVSLSALDLPVLDPTSSDNAPSDPVADADHSGTPDPHAAAMIDGDATMFVVYTSGSTGRPKGVPGTHRAVLNRSAWEFDAVPYAADETMAQKTTFDFVDHVAELWAPLVAGRPVVVIPDSVVRQPNEFVEALARHRARRIVMVPSLLDALLDTVPDLAERLPDLQRWTLSGERLQVSLASRFRDRLPDRTLVNVYGMSEVMADATAYEVLPRPDRSDPIPDPIPVGRPISNQRVYVLDRVGRPAPVGVPGQIWVSGVGLTDGYWRRDDLTAERFADNPFGDGDHRRRYATGDLGRWSADGQLEFLGRIDRQVKIRGIRVELGDVEAALREITGVRDAAVVDASGPDEPTVLAADVVADPDLDLVDVRRQLRELLPAAFVPAEVERLDELPLLPSGKLDRRALVTRRRNVRFRRRSRSDDRRVEDPDMELMLGIWRDVVDAETIDADDDFFDVGGHSLAGMRLLARIKREFDVNLELSVLYDAATPRSLLERVGGGPVSGDLPPHLVRVSTASDPARTLYCVHGAGGNVLNLRDLARELAPDWGVTGIQARGVDGTTPPHASLDEMCEAYISSIDADRPDGPLFLAGFSGGGIVAFEMACRMADRGRPVDALMLLDTFHPTVRGRRRTVGEHLAALARQGPGYLLERFRVRRQRRLYADADQIVEARTEPGQPVPHELRDAHLVNNTVAILDRYQPRHYAGPVSLLAASDVLDVFRHAGADRGWSDWTSDFRCEAVPGSHHDFVLPPHVTTLATTLRAHLEEFLEAAPGGVRR